MAVIAGAAIAGAVSIFQGFGARSSAKKLANERRRLLDLGLANASPEVFLKFLNTLQPKFRQLIAQNLGGKFKGAIASQLARRGLTGTGLGASLSIGASAIPGISLGSICTE